MWTNNWRQKAWSNLDQNWDIIVIGGGITGAGIFREAARLQLRVLLVEQRDFAWGTSSRSSKFVHGGLRYLKEGQIGLTRDAVHEREQLIHDAPGLVEPIGFLLATYKRDKIGRLVYRAGLSIYDLLAMQWSHKYYRPSDFQMLAPHIETEGLKGGFHYKDAQTDDARLVLRVIQAGLHDGRDQAQAMNYTTATNLLYDDNGRVNGLLLRDDETGQTQPVCANVVINATGAWADELREKAGGEAVLRPLRGSHLIFPGWRLPVAQVLTILHPIDQRPVMIFPWEGATVVGTTDIDHQRPLSNSPCISGEEVTYLMTAVASQFPSLNINLNDVIATFSGVRPVIGSGKKDPSDESRDHVIWQDKGLLTVTGGKLTTFRLIALETLRQAQPFLPDCPEIDEHTAVLEPPIQDLPKVAQIDPALMRRLAGRYGSNVTAVIANAQPDELNLIEGTKYSWAELRWGAQAEGVVHLEDLLLRRLRIGLLLPDGGESLLPRIREICQPLLGWDDGRWQEEEKNYLTLWQHCHSLPPMESIADWNSLLAEFLEATETSEKRPWATPLKILFLTLIVSVTLYTIWSRRKRNHSSS